MSRQINCLLFFFSVLTILNSDLHAQRFGGNAPSLKWNQFQSRAGNVIYNPGSEFLAKRVTTIVNNLSWVSEGSLGNEIRPINIVLQSQPIITNGYVGLAPWRSEFFLTPLQNTLQFGTSKWIDNLAVHEYRHVHQYANFRKGISKLAYLIAGQEGQALANAAAVPDWFFEGDAVYSETKFLSHGRGRMPFFFDPYHSLWQANKKYPYQKLRNGSWRDYVPDHYALGYLLVQYGYKEYGDDFWGKVTDDAVRFKGIFYPFQQAVKKHAGISFNDFVSKAIDSYKLNMKKNSEGDEVLIGKVDEKKVVDYQFPLWIGKDSILALRSAYNEISKWVVIQNGIITRLSVKDIGVDDYFTYRNGKIVYTGYSPDARWQWREYNDIMMYDIVNRSINKITKGGRYFSPDLSHDESKIVAVNVDGNGRSTLELIEVETKSKLKTLDNLSNYFFSYPIFSENDSTIYVVANDSTGNTSILSIDLFSGNQQQVIQPLKTPIAYLRVMNNKLIFTVTNHQRNELWQYDLERKKLNLLSSSSTGSYAGGLNVNGDQVVYSKPTAEGHQLFKRNVIGSSGLNSIEAASLVYPTSFSGENHEEIIDATVQLATPLPYKKSTDIFNIHSWRPYYEQPEWSFTMYGQNVLNTLQTQLKYTFNENERSQKMGLSGTFGAWFPWIVTGTDYTFSRKFSDSIRSLTWNEWNGNIGLRLPLNFSAGKFYRNLDLSTNIYGAALDYDKSSKPAVASKMISYLQQQLTWSMQLQKSVQQIFPQFALAIKLQHRYAIGNINANQFNGSTSIYLPGIGKTHSFVAGFVYQGRDTLRQYAFSNGFGMPRGYTALNYPRMMKVGLNYHAPLLYPDLGVANLVYVKRIRSNFFYDTGWFKSLRTGKTTALRSGGLEVYFDTRWWNQQPVTVGFRYSRLMDTDQFQTKPNPNRWEFILPLNLIPG